jgi:hypothetical protein
MVFCFVQNFFFGQHENYNIYCYCRAKREFFFQNSTLGYMTNTLNHIYFYFLHQNQNIFFSNIGNKNIFLEKKPITSPLQVKWSFPKTNCDSKRCNCRKHGLECSVACTECQGNTCSNMSACEDQDSDSDE